MSTFIERTEFAVYEAGNDSRNADDWFDNKEDAIARAKATGGRVDQVDHYATNYTQIFSANPRDEDEED